MFIETQLLIVRLKYSNFLNSPVARQCNAEEIDSTSFQSSTLPCHHFREVKSQWEIGCHALTALRSIHDKNHQVLGATSVE